MREAVFRLIEFAMRDTGTRAHALYIPGSNRGTIAHAVLVRERAFEHVADDFHITMAVRTEAHASGHAVFVDHAQRSETHMRRIVIVGEGKTVKTFQPAMIGVTTIVGFSDFHHFFVSCFMAIRVIR